MRWPILFTLPSLYFVSVKVMSSAFNTLLQRVTKTDLMYKTTDCIPLASIWDVSYVILKVNYVPWVASVFLLSKAQSFTESL